MWAARWSERASESSSDSSAESKSWTDLDYLEINLDRWAGFRSQHRCLCGVLSYGAMVCLVAVFVAFYAPGQRVGEGIDLKSFHEAMVSQGYDHESVQHFIQEVQNPNTEAADPQCHQHPWVFFLPCMASLAAALTSVKMFRMAWSWHLWFQGLFLLVVTIYALATAMDELAFELCEGWYWRAPAGPGSGQLVLKCAPGFLHWPGFDWWILRNYRVLTQPSTSLFLRGSMQAVVALNVEAFVLYRLKCLRAIAGKRGTCLYINISILWWLQVVLALIVLLPFEATGIIGEVRVCCSVLLVIAYLISATQMLSVLVYIYCQLQKYHQIALDCESKQGESSKVLQGAKDRAARQFVNYFCSASLSVIVGTVVGVSNARAFKFEGDNIDLYIDQNYALWYMSFVLPSVHVLVLIALVLPHMHARIAQQGRLNWCRQRQRLRHVMDPEWRRKVQELSDRGISLEALLGFYKRLGKDLMPHFDPSVHTTRDVVRQAVIPATRSSGEAYATQVAQGRAVRAQHMVTHSWDNLFRDLVAAVVADGLGELTFALVAKALSDVQLLEQMLTDLGQLSTTYWICAFAVNQHTSICSVSEGVDSTGVPIVACDCSVPKCLNGTAPLDSRGRSLSCELNKFDHMMAVIAQGDPDFSQLIAVDGSFGLFQRAWCIAELAEAALEQHIGDLEDMRVEFMQASRPEDVQEILSKIPDIDTFNEALHKLILDPQLGILAQWVDLDAVRQMEEVGRLLRWGKVDQGRGVVWTWWCT
ncbi:unnamed protein product [Effrenium voratum]|nr:unnamed protein product [Effrenium voratum]